MEKKRIVTKWVSGRVSAWLDGSPDIAVTGYHSEDEAVGALIKAYPEHFPTIETTLLTV
jgi:hypothetical protein